MEECKLERMESCDMLRVLQNGYRIKMLKARNFSIGVDTLNDLEVVDELMNQDTFFKIYKDK